MCENKLIWPIELVIFSRWTLLSTSAKEGFHSAEYYGLTYTSRFLPQLTRFSSVLTLHTSGHNLMVLIPNPDSHFHTYSDRWDRRISRSIFLLSYSNILIRR